MPTTRKDLIEISAHPRSYPRSQFYCLAACRLTPVTHSTQTQALYRQPSPLHCPRPSAPVHVCCLVYAATGHSNCLDLSTSPQCRTHTSTDRSADNCTSRNSALLVPARCGSAAHNDCSYMHKYSTLRIQDLAHSTNLPELPQDVLH